jgi:hypothetical protein
MNEKEYRVTVSVAAAPDEAARLRVLLRDALEGSGFRLTAGVTTVESWLVVAMGVPPAPFNGSRGRPESEHVRRGS